MIHRGFALLDVVITISILALTTVTLANAVSSLNRAYQRSIAFDNALRVVERRLEAPIPVGLPSEPGPNGVRIVRYPLTPHRMIQRVIAP
jgi:hypothetical protein